MLYEELADIHSDLSWVLLELRLKLPAASDETDRAKALARADAALERLNAIIAVIAQVSQEERPAITVGAMPVPERRH